MGRKRIEEQRQKRKEEQLERGNQEGWELEEDGRKRVRTEKEQRRIKDRPT